MSPRDLLRILAVVLVLAGGAILLYNAIQPPPPPPPPQTVLVASRNLKAYAVLRPDSNAVQTTEIPADSVPPGALREWPQDAVLILRSPANKGEVITRNAVVEGPPGKKDVEVLSFPVEFDKAVAGQIRPGHEINIYGFRTAREESNLAPVTLVADHVWVVDARTTAGGETEARPTQQSNGGPLNLGGLGQPGTGPASIVTVAVEPAIALKIVEALGANAYKAWATLSGSSVVTPTPGPTLTPTSPLSTATPQPCLKLDRTTVIFQAAKGGANPDPQQVQVNNPCAGTLEWKASVTGAPAWLEVTPTSGTAPSSFAVAVNIAGLAEGVYSAEIVVDGGRGTQNSPQAVGVVLVVIGSTATPPPTPTQPPKELIIILKDWRLTVPPDWKCANTGGLTWECRPGVRQVKATVRNETEERWWVERQDRDRNARVTIQGGPEVDVEGERYWLDPGEEATIDIQLIEGAKGAKVVLVDG